MQNALATINAAVAIWRFPANLCVMICPDAMRITLMLSKSKLDGGSAVPLRLK